MDGDNEEVGFGRPPKEHRWKPGQSGNRRGRPKGARNFKTDLEELLSSRVAVTEGGRKRKVPVQRAVLLRLGEKALKGDSRAIEKLLDLALGLSDERAGREAERALTGREEEILAEYVAAVAAPLERRGPVDEGEAPSDAD